MLLQSGKKQHRRSLKFAIVCVALGVTVLAAKVLWTQWRRHASESRCDETTEQRLRLVSVTKCNSSKGTPRNARNTIHFITAVRRQTETYADLTRLANALAQVANLHWHLIEIDDDDSGSPCTNAYHEVPSRLNIVNTHVRLGVAHRTRDASDKQACLSDISVFKMAVKWSLANEHLNGFVHFGRLGSLYPPGFFNGLEGSKNVTAYTNVFALEGEEDEEPVNIGFLAPVTDQDGVVGFAGAIPPGFSYPLAFVYRSEYLKSATLFALPSVDNVSLASNSIVYHFHTKHRSIPVNFAVPKQETLVHWQDTNLPLLARNGHKQGRGRQMVQLGTCLSRWCDTQEVQFDRP